MKDNVIFQMQFGRRGAPEKVQRLFVAPDAFENRPT
jgi:hypothetical protein